MLVGGPGVKIIMTVIKTAADELRNSIRASQVLANENVAAVITNEGGSIVAANETALKLFAASHHEFINDSMEQHILHSLAYFKSLLDTNAKMPIPTVSL